MSFYKKAIFSTCLLSLTACSTLNESMQLGAGVGAITGLAAVSAAGDIAGKNPSDDQKLTSASVGIALGLLTSYLLHKNIEEKRVDFLQSGPEIHFGDLPPSPFIMTPVKKKKGGK
jgi:hypothetical protein